MHQAQPVSRITTDAVRPRERAAFWREVVCRTFVELDCSPLGPGPLEGRIEDIAAGDRHLCRVDATAQHVVRGSPQIAHSREAYVVVCVQRSGRCAVRQDGREARLEPGSLAAVDSTRPYVLHFDGPFSQHVLRIPQHSLAQRIGRSERYTALALSAGDGLAALLRDFLDRLAPALAEAAPAMRARLFATALELAAAALVSRVTPGASGSQHRLVLLCRARQYCEERLGDARLSPAEVAAAVGISERYLQRLFSTEDAPVMQWMWKRRLVRCGEQLADPAMNWRSIGDIAYAHGFSDLAHFSRRFKACFGLSPSDYRARSAGITSATNSSSERIAMAGGRLPKEKTHSR